MHAVPLAICWTLGLLFVNDFALASPLMTTALSTLAVTSGGYIAMYAQVSTTGTESRRMYTVSNLVKAFALAVYTPFAARTLWLAICDNVWDTDLIQRLSVLYAVPDFLSLLLVRRMSMPTIVHHLFVVAFTCANTQVDYTTDTVCRGIVVYACFSTFSYSVNALLGFRFIYTELSYLSALSAAVYGTCLSINWAYQVYFVSIRFSVAPRTMLLYALSLTAIVYDDIVLFRWLIRNACYRTS